MISSLHFFRGFSLLLLVVLLSACASGESPLVRSGFKADYVVVQKHDRVLSLWANGKIIKSYPILALGADPVGHKRQEGDERTPEGRYYINEKHESKNFQKFLEISYPNEEDKRLAKTRHVQAGGNVGIHGDRGGWDGFLQRFDGSWTDGCITLRNNDVEEVYGLVDIGTPIWIKP